MDMTSAAMDAVLRLRQAEADSSNDSGSATPQGVFVDCGAGNEYDGRLGLRISSIFVILVGSLIGAVVPVLLARGTKMKVNGTAFFIAKYFGSGIIIGTAFLHLLSPAFAALNNPCLPEGPFKKYDFAAGICLITVLVMFTVELLVSRFDIFGHSHDSPEREIAPPHVQPKESPLPEATRTPSDIEANWDTSTPHSENDGRDLAGSPASSGFHAPGLPNDVSYPPGGRDHLGHHREHENDPAALASQLTAIFILEFGVVFHSVFIGLTLAVAGEEFTVLYIVLVFHQTFEGLGLGSRLAAAQWPQSKQWLPYLLGFGYAISTPISIAIGLGVRETLQPGSSNALIVNGIFDSISAGILIYTGLVELLAHEFMFNEHMRNAGIKIQLYALSCVAFGAGVMAILAIWA
ncbi:putative plasma membrane low affinity zinc ion protein [Rosellinia necatrix]|uniref:Putative plasma membrane low affinity zinc ion protein n=1 Tax=Rosellinia necatrix TaxID=77044 RepID=A0A1W2TKN1_ROSNE|nr:putative plasma membrane low affinity zinc ion protein [Rosellinia necatrix]